MTDFSILKTFIQKVSIYRVYDKLSNNVTLSNNANSRMGLSCNLELGCNDCLYQISFCTSKECSKLEQTSERNPYEINLRTVTTSRNWEGTWGSFELLSLYMNIHSMSEPIYRNLNDEFHVAHFDAASESMQKEGKH